VPWLYDEAGTTGPTASDVLRFFTKLKCRLMPYLYGAAVEAHESGVPTMRAMVLEFPGDPGCDQLDRQYMLGPSLLVAPVFSPESTVDYYLPPGRWTNFLSGDVVDGGRWVRETHGYTSLPLMVRSNTVLPVGANERKPDYDFAEGVTFQIFQLQDGATATAAVPTVKGDLAVTLTANRTGQEIHIQAKGASSGWSVLLRGIDAVQGIRGGTAQPEALGVRVTPNAGGMTLTVDL
jgi:alpha-D-xyloside xylohydrolase